MEKNGSTNGTTEACNERKGVCVALFGDGKTKRLYSDLPTDFIQQIVDSTIAWINFSTNDLEREGLEVAVSLGFSTSLYTQMLNAEYSAYQDLEIELGIRLPAVSVDGYHVNVRPLIILMRKNLILTIHSERLVRFVGLARYADIFLKKLPKESPPADKVTVVLHRIIDENITKNFDYLKNIEEAAGGLNDLMVASELPGYKMAKELHKIKSMIITYMYTLWGTLDVLHSLRYGDAELISDNNRILGKITLLVEDVNRHISITEHMSEVLSSGLEVVQTIYNNQLQQLNNRITWIAAWLAIMSVAAIVPNTIATILSSEIWGLRTGNPYHLTVYLVFLIVPTSIATYVVYMWIRRIAGMPIHAADAEVKDKKDTEAETHVRKLKDEEAKTKNTRIKEKDMERRADEMDD